MLTTAALAVMVQQTAMPVARLSLMVMQQQAMLLVMVQPTALAVIRLALPQNSTTLWPKPSAPAPSWLVRDTHCNIEILCQVRLRVNGHFPMDGGLKHLCCSIHRQPQEMICRLLVMPFARTWPALANISSLAIAIHIIKVEQHQLHERFQQRHH